ncbi:MAG: hypothetical protein WAK60_05395 [Sedimentisphaerales bacterium]
MQEAQIPAVCEGVRGMIMIMTFKRSKFASAATLVEVTLSIVIVALAAIGALNYQYYAAIHARIAKAQITATRTAQLLLEDWKSTGGSVNYDPSTLGLGFSAAIRIPDQWLIGHGGELGAPLQNSVHSITVDSLPMLVMLRWQDVAVDAGAQLKLRQLSVIVGVGVTDGNGNLTFPEHYLANIPDITLSTYACVDGG